MVIADRSPSPEFDPFALGIEDFAPLPEYKAAGETALDFDGLLSAPLKLHEDLTSGCGGQTWPAGMVLAKHMLRHHQDKLNDARILELGAGGGLVGLAVASACPLSEPLLVTDMKDMLSLMEHNIVLNGLQENAEALILNWYVFAPDCPQILVRLKHVHICSHPRLSDNYFQQQLKSRKERPELILRLHRGEPLPERVVAFKPNVILAADCVYFEPAFPLLLATLTELMELCPATVVYFCFKKRRRADMQFLKKAQKKFRVEEVADEDRPVFSRQGLFLFTFSSRQAIPDASQRPS